MRSTGAAPGSAELVGDLLTELPRVTSRLAEEDLHALPSTALGDSLVALRREMDRLEAEFSRRLAVFERTQGYAASAP